MEQQHTALVGNKEVLKMLGMQSVSGLNKLRVRVQPFPAPISPTPPPPRSSPSAPPPTAPSPPTPPPPPTTPT
ncbi:hypothetical protein 9AX3_1, partial [uncultured Caudovirales phage]